MRERIKAAANILLRPMDWSLGRRELEWERSAATALYESLGIWAERKFTRPVECIIFSKDRALQLHALLSSYQEKVLSPAPVHVLYQASTRAHQRAYDDVEALFSGVDATFVRQRADDSFRQDVLDILKKLRSEKVFFLVDDILFTEEVDLADFAKFNTDVFVPTLRMGGNLSVCFTLQKDQPQPPFLTHEAAGPDKIVWRWDQGVYDWNYPLSLDGHLFSLREISVMTDLIAFQAPNSYEGNLQKFRWLYLNRLGVAYRKSKVVNLACNKVQTENDNLCGNVHQDVLLEQWHKGFQMDYRKLFGLVNQSAHQDVAFNLVPRRKE